MAHGDFVAYYRVSTARQGSSGLGLEAQREAVHQHLNGEQSRLVGEFTEVESGRKQHRPELEKALKTARLHRVPLLVAKLDRLARSTVFLHKLLDSDVEIRFCDLPEVTGPQGRFLLQSMVNVAELEAGLISTRTKAALSAAKARGVKLGGNRGSIISAAAQNAGRDASRRRADQRAEELAPVLEEMQERNFSLRAMARELEQRGIPTARGNTLWTPTQIKRLIARQGKGERRDSLST